MRVPTHRFLDSLKRLRKRHTTMINVYEYTDYRKFLRDYCESMKKEDARFSYRSFASQCAINPGNFIRMLNGRRNLTLASAVKLSSGLNFTIKEKNYFQTMILFCHAMNHGDKKRYFEEMMSFKESAVRFLNADQYEFYDAWYYTAVRESLAFFPLNDHNFKELGNILTPSISLKDVAKAVSLLLKLGLIEKRGHCYKRTDALISTGNNIRSIVLNNFVINTMKLAEQAVNRGTDEMNLSTVTLSISGDGFHKVQDEVRAFRRRIMEIAKECPGPDRVYQCNMQVFPLTQRYLKDQQ